MMKISIALTLFLAAVPASALGVRNLFKSKKTVAAPPAAVVAPQTRPRLPPKILDNKGLDYIFEKNKLWQAEKIAGDKDFFKKLGTTHTPEYMYIGE
jgi:hypothetical protein